MGCLRLDHDPPHVVLDARTTKNRLADTLPLRADLVREIRLWLAERARLEGRELPVTTRIFHVPVGLLTCLKKDLALAGIPYRDSEGRVLDVHSLRHTTASHMARKGVAPRSAQAMMRHQDIRLTMETYADPRLLDKVSALSALPELPSVMDRPAEG